MSATTPARLSGQDRLWRKAVKYPDAQQRFRATGDHDLLRSMRVMIRMTGGALVLLFVIVGAAIAGFALPDWAPNLMGVVAVGIMFGSTPPARYLLASLALTWCRSRWSGTWLDADVPLARLWTMQRSPVPPEEFAEYARALAKDKSARLDGGTDPRLVWALAERGIAPAQVTDYHAAGLTAEDAVRLCDSDLTLADWREILRVGVPFSKGRVEPVLRFVEWVRVSRASLHPSQFGRDLPARTVAECLPVMDMWNRIDRFEVAHATRCPRTEAEGSLPCVQCGGTERGGHRDWFVNQTMQQVTVREWVHVTGALAPYFIVARIGLGEAKALLAQDPQPTAAELEFLAAFND